MNARITSLNTGQNGDAALPTVWPGATVLRLGQAQDTATALALPHLPRHRSILAVDIENSTTRANLAKARLRELMYEMVEEAMLTGGIDEGCRDPLVDRGDGVLALVHPVDQAATALLVNPIIPTLNRLLIEHAEQHPELRLRMRAVIHAGEVHYDRRGCFGEALDIAFRLLDSPRVKKTFRNSEASMILVVSEVIYQSVIRQGYLDIDDKEFKPVVQVRVAGQRHRGWIHVPEGAEVGPRG